MRLFEKWAYLGFGAEELRDHESAVMRENCGSLRVQGLLFGVLCAVMSIIVIFNGSTTAGIIILIYAVLSFVLGQSGGSISRKGDASCRVMEFLLFTFNIVGYIAAIYLGTFLAGNDPSIMFIAAIMYFQINFDMAPYKNFIVTILMYVIFIGCVFFSKDYSTALLDLQDSTLVFIAGLCISWFKSRTRWENEIMVERLERANYSLYHDSVTDVLTGLPNRRQVFDFLEDLRKECAENETYFTCVIMDLDFFKDYNDTYGHDKGDELLSDLGERLNRLALDNGISIGRIGGEEFMAFGEEENRAAAEINSEKIREEIMKAHHAETDAGKYQTASVGIYCEKPDKDFKVIEAYRCADHALYKAKESGRNCCFTYIKENDSYRRAGKEK